MAPAPRAVYPFHWRWPLAMQLSTGYFAGSSRLYVVVCRWLCISRDVVHPEFSAWALGLGATRKRVGGKSSDVSETRGEGVDGLRLVTRCPGPQMSRPQGTGLYGARHSDPGKQNCAEQACAPAAGPQNTANVHERVTIDWHDTTRHDTNELCVRHTTHTCTYRLAGWSLQAESACAHVPLGSQSYPTVDCVGPSRRSD